VVELTRYSHFLPPSLPPSLTSGPAKVLSEFQAGTADGGCVDDGGELFDVVDQDTVEESLCE